MPKCHHCLKEIPIEEEISFCPFCGQKITQDVSRDQADLLGLATSVQPSNKIVWYQNELIEISNTILDTIDRIQMQHLSNVLKVIQGEEFQEQVRDLYRSIDRTRLLSNLDELLLAIEKTIANREDETNQSIFEKLQDIISEYDQRISKLYRFFELENNQLDQEISSISIKSKYTHNQLNKLLKAVKQSYTKYIQCVKDHNMFAAFPSDSSYGSFRAGRMNNFILRNREIIENTDSTELIESVIERLEASNQMPYYGHLDEDPSPHVNAFWDGLEWLSFFISDQYSTDIQSELNLLLDKVNTELIRNIKYQIAHIDMELVKELEAYQAELDRIEDDQSRNSKGDN